MEKESAKPARNDLVVSSLVVRTPMAKRSAKATRNDLVVSGLALRAPGHASLVLSAGHSGKPTLYLMGKCSNVVTVAIDTDGRCSVVVSKEEATNSTGAGLAVDVFGAGMGVSVHQGHRVKAVCLEECGLVADSSIGEPDSAGRLRGISHHGRMSPVSPPKTVDA